MNETSSLVSTITKFFKDALSEKGEVSLVQLLWYVDYTQRLIPTAHEIACALAIQKDVYVRKAGEKIYFVRADHIDQIGNEEVISLIDEDLENAYQHYNKEFWKTHKELSRKL